LTAYAEVIGFLVLVTLGFTALFLNRIGFNLLGLCQEGICFPQ